MVALQFQSISTNTSQETDLSVPKTNYRTKQLASVLRSGNYKLIKNSEIE